MATRSLIRSGETLPSLFDDFFRPWNEWAGNTGLWGREMTVPAVNIAETKDSYQVSVAAPGLKKSDFKIDVQANMLTISSEKEEEKEKEDKGGRYTRREYSYSSFNRSFMLPDEINQDKIEAIYEDGVLKVTLPKKEDAKKLAVSKHIAIK